MQSDTRQRRESSGDKSLGLLIVRAPASKSDKTDDFKIGRWIGVVNDNGRFVSEKVGDDCQLSMRSFMR